MLHAMRLLFLPYILVALSASFTLQAQTFSANNATERWDAKTFSYSNYQYGFGWKLPSDFEWVREPGEERHTPFRAIGGPFLVFVNAQEVGKNTDLWTLLPTLQETVERIDETHEKETGKMVYERTWEKCSLFGQHALKTTFKEYFEDNRFDEAIESYAEEYYLIRGSNNLTIAIKINKDVFDQIDCTPFFKSIIQGFILTTIQ